ncbi:MAG: DUF2231 domain-containing protein [Phycisphaeraceae bacterium]
MAEAYDRGVHSKARLFGHPLHPMVIPFPIAFLCGALVTDLVYWGTGDAFWARMSLWLIVGGFVTAFAASVLGMIDFFTIPRARSHAAGWVHAVGNFAVILLAILNAALRWPAPEARVLWGGLTLSAIVTVLLIVTGWVGGELSYRYKIGVMDAPSPEAEQQAMRRRAA